MWVSRLHTAERWAAGLYAALVLQLCACSGVDRGLLATAEPGPDGGDDGTGGFDNTGAGDGDGDSNELGDASTPDDAAECAQDPDSEQVPTCSRPQADATCFEGECYLVQCLQDYRDCNLDAVDGCEVSKTDPDHCGGCNQACSRPGALFECVDDQCVYVGCAEGFSDCDADEVNGCEVDVTTTTNCGQCGVVCPVPPMGAPACVDGRCGVGECMIGFGNCDGTPENGCEQRLDTDAHCGSCDADCTTLPDASGRCETNTCVVDNCDNGMVDCNGIGADGCETRPDSPDNCGGCGIACDLPGTRAHGCDSGLCRVEHSCADGEGNCVPDSPQAGCDDGRADCDLDPANGCEAFLTDVEHCGSCGNSCVIASAIPTCNAGACEVAGCELGFDQCVAGGPCVSLLDDDGSCGGCGDACGLGEHCAGGVCSTVDCAPQTADCDADPGNGCEADLRQPQTCGGCAITCGPYANATGTCNAGQCAIDVCTAGYADCDGVVGNGCEVDVSRPEQCGQCGNDCTQLPGVDDAACNAGQCAIVACTPGRADCDPGAPGCETNFALPDDCGACGNDCRALPYTLSVGCNGGTCEFSCQVGFADCGGGPGCETDLDALQTCGSCDNDCSSLPNVASASCSGGACTDITCSDGFEDCDQLVFTGCEQSVRNTQNCGGCGVLCAPAGATASSCASGSCEYTCGGALKDCNGDPADGCEQDTRSDNAHCGGCNVTCDGTCEGGVCQCANDAQCGEGEACCNGTCADLSADANCGACGNACVLWYACQSGCCRSSPWSPCGL